MNKKWLFAPLLILSLLVGIYFYNKYRVAPKLNLSGLELSTVVGDTVNINRFKGKKTILCFSASWCGPCRHELKNIGKVKTSALADVQVIVISDEEPGVINAFAESLHPDFTILKLNKSFADINIYSIPTTYLLDKNFEVKKESVGYVDWSDPSTLEHLRKILE